MGVTVNANTARVVRTRKNVLTLGKPGDDLDWYAKAVSELQKRPLTDPTGWRYLAAVHGYPGHNADPFAKAGEALPSAAEQQQFWNQCQHQTWFFLPWHRGYLACFEEIIADVVTKLGGPSGWALPYWNYSDATNPNARSLPPTFLNPFNADRSPNPIWVDGRNLKNATDQLPAGDVDLDALVHWPFGGSAVGGDPGFGGPETVFSHFGGVNGRLENVPHNVIHDDVGGLMSDPNTAALDPIFWLHHSNIDRLWEVWTHRDPTFIDPNVPAWLTDVSFVLHDSAGMIVNFDSSQMRDASAVRHGYQYDDISDPIPKTPTVAANLAMVRQMVTTAQPPTLVGASQTSIAITGPSTSVHVLFRQPARESAIVRLAGTRPARAFLNLENITGTGLYGSYEVYIDAPPTGTNGTGRSPLFAGHLSTFGVRKASLPDSPHGGSGITSVLEITSLIEQLHRDRGWDGERLEVTFVPKASGSAGREAAKMDLRIGRVSVYYS
jgi:tyrosinase